MFFENSPSDPTFRAPQSPNQAWDFQKRGRICKNEHGSLRPPTWTFARQQSPSYQTYSDVKHTSRKPTIKSTILEGQTLDLSLPGYVYKQKTDFIKNLMFSSLARLRHTSGIKSCASWDVF